MTVTKTTCHECGKRLDDEAVALGWPIHWRYL